MPYSPKLSIKQIIDSYDLSPEKKLGQNFIINPSLTNKIASFAGDITDRIVIEIGPGPGALTRAILDNGVKKLILIEKDKKFEPLLLAMQEYYTGRLEVFFTDALEIPFSEFGKDLLIIANLPYNISTPFLIKACEENSVISGMILMFQKEVADRISALPNCKAYGRLSVIAQSIFEVKNLLTINKEAFFPPPKVTSALISFSKKKLLPSEIEIEQLMKMSNILFQKRRKMLKGILKGFDLSITELQGIDWSLRPENLTPEMILTLAKHIKSKIF